MIIPEIISNPKIDEMINRLDDNKLYCQCCKIWNKKQNFIDCYHFLYIVSTGRVRSDVKLVICKYCNSELNFIIRKYDTHCKIHSFNHKKYHNIMDEMRKYFIGKQIITQQDADKYFNFLREIYFLTDINLLFEKEIGVNMKEIKYHYGNGLL